MKTNPRIELYLVKLAKRVIHQDVNTFTIPEIVEKDINFESQEDRDPDAEDREVDDFTNHQFDFKDYTMNQTQALKVAHMVRNYHKRVNKVELTKPKRQRRRQFQITECPHTNEKYYAKGMC